MKWLFSEWNRVKQELVTWTSFWPYTAFLTEGHVVTLHSTSELLFISLYQHHLKIWRPKVLRYICACAERGTGRQRLRRCVQCETGWVKKSSYLPSLAIYVAAQVNATVHWWVTALCSEPANKSPKFTKHLNSWKFAYFPTGIKQRWH